MFGNPADRFSHDAVHIESHYDETNSVKFAPSETLTVSLGCPNTENFMSSVERNLHIVKTNRAADQAPFFSLHIAPSLGL